MSDQRPDAALHSAGSLPEYPRRRKGTLAAGAHARRAQPALTAGLSRRPLTAQFALFRVVRGPQFQYSRQFAATCRAHQSVFAVPAQ